MPRSIPAIAFWCVVLLSCSFYAPAYAGDKGDGDVQNQWIELLGDPSFGPVLGAKTPGSSAQKSTDFMGIDFKRTPAKANVEEFAVDLSLKWLSRNQEPDGHWDSVKFGAETDADIEQTSFAMLAFMFAGGSDKVGMYKDNLKRACEWLCRQQRDDGAICRREQPADGITHAIAGLVLAELYGMNPNSKAREYAQKAIDYSTQRHQSKKDNQKWGFGRSPQSPAPDLLSTTLFVMQMKSAKVAGLHFSADSFDGVIKFLDSLEEKDGRSFRFAAGEYPSLSATLMGCLCRQFLGWKKEDLEPIAEKILAPMQCNAAATDSDVLLNYFGFILFYQFGGSQWNGSSGMWKEFIENVRPKLEDARRRDGNAEGSWDPKGTWAGAGRVLSTALNAICSQWH